MKIASKTSKLLYFCAIVAVLWVFPRALLADQIILRNGQVITGHIINQNQNAVVIRTRNGVQNISKAQITRVLYGDFPDPEEERRKQEEERQRQEQLRKAEELRKQQELDRIAEEQRQAEEARRKAEEEQNKRNNEPDNHSGDPSDSAWYSHFLPREFSGYVWDPNLEGHALKAGLSTGTINHDWLGTEQIATFRKFDVFFASSQGFTQRAVEPRSGWHLTGDLEYGINRYFVQLRASVSRQNGDAAALRAGPQKNLTIDNVERVFGDFADLGTLQYNRMRWEEGRFLLGYRILYGGDWELDFLAGMHRSDSLADLDYESFALFTLTADRQYRFFNFRSFTEMKGPLIGFRGTYRIPSDLAPDKYAWLIPLLEWEALYQQSSGVFEYSYLSGGASLLYGARFGKQGANTTDYFGTGGQGSLGLVFSLPYNLTLHVGFFGSEILFKGKDYYNITDDSSLGEKLRSLILPKIFSGFLTVKEVHRGTYMRIQWEHRL
ncbi:MAG: hypothetical protein KDK37_00725 [Leptospiraceae bacterium]|nr:hypothetical protein [Leptospiraceae bacterium]